MLNWCARNSIFRPKLQIVPSGENQIGIRHFRVLNSLSVYILWLSHFDINLFRQSSFPVYHRQCKQNKFLIQNGLYIHASSRFKDVSEREGRFLLFSYFWKYHLQRMCKFTYEMNLEVISKNPKFRFQTPDD